MEKSIKWLKIARKGAVMLASLVVFVGFVLDVIFRYLGITSLIGSRMVASGLIVACIVYGLSIGITFIVDKLKRKSQSKEENNISSKTGMIFNNKFFNFINKHEEVIRLFTYVVALALSLYFAISAIISTYNWDIYYFFCIFFWLSLFIGVMELFYSKNKQTFITQAVILGLTLGTLISATIFAHKLHFEIVSGVDTNILNFLYMTVTLLMLVVNLIIVSDNDIMKVKSTRNFGAGIILMCISICIYYASEIAKFLVGKWELNENLQHFYEVTNSLTYVVIVLSMFAMVNVAANTIHYIKTKNYLGLVDIGASFISVILSLFGLLYYTNFVLFL